MNWYNKFTKIAQRAFLEGLGVAEDVIQYVESQPNEVKQYLVNALRQNSQMTVEELQSITIPQREAVSPTADEQNILNRIPAEQNEFRDWLSSQLIKARAGRIPDPQLYDRLSSDYGQLIDWHNFVNPDLDSYSAEQALISSDDWHSEMAAEGSGKAYQEKNVVHTFDDGWTIQEVKTRNDLQVEGNKMGHCVGSYCPGVEAEKLRIFSLRDPRNEPHVTIESDMAGEKFKQIQGKENKEPLPKYMQYIFEWKGEEVEPLEGMARYDLGGQTYFADGSQLKEYRNKQGEYHREDGPAVIYANGNKEWWLNRKLHRENGPAIEWANGNKDWWLNGKRHRENGPAIEYASGRKDWYRNGKLHREGGPAIERANGDKHWYLHGERHRENGPAIELANGHKEWYLNGKLHREDGPAVEYANGNKYWYLNGLQISEKEYWEKVKRLKKERAPTKQANWYGKFIKIADIKPWEPDYKYEPEEIVEPSLQISEDAHTKPYYADPRDVTEEELAKVPEILAKWLEQQDIDREGEFRKKMLSRYNFTFKMLRASYSEDIYRFEYHPRGIVPLVEEMPLWEGSKLTKQVRFYPDVESAVDSVNDDPLMAYRGMSFEEFAQGMGRGYIQSAETYNLGEFQRGLTFFSDNFSTASYYASGFAPIQYRPTRQLPGVVIEVPREKLKAHEDFPTATTPGEFVATEPLMIKDINQMWMLVPVQIQDGSFEVIHDKYRDEYRGGSASGISVSYAIVPYDL